MFVSPRMSFVHSCHVLDKRKSRNRSKEENKSQELDGSAKKSKKKNRGRYRRRRIGDEHGGTNCSERSAEDVIFPD